MRRQKTYYQVVPILEMIEKNRRLALNEITLKYNYLK